MAKITATRALNELKLLDKRIQKKIRNSCFITYKVKDQIQNQNCRSEADFQSISDLIAQREMIKSALMKSNSITKVVINGEEMTVAEAIEKKNSIAYLKSLLQKMVHQLQTTTREIEMANAEAQERLDRLLEANFGKDMKVRDDELEAVSEAFWANNRAEAVDELKLQEKCEKLDKDIDGFENEVDLVLSEVNARTEIEI